MNPVDAQPINVTIYVGDRQIETLSYYSGGEWDKDSQLDSTLTEFIAYLKYQLKDSLPTGELPHEVIERNEYDALEKPAADVLYIVREGE